MAIFKTFVGICPEYNEETTITVEYTEIKTLGSHTVYRKYLGYDCDIGSYRGCSQENCPLVDER